jgi:mutator protein MutT
MRTEPADRIVPVVAAVVRRDGTYLLCRRAPGKRHGGLWEFPGGKIQPGESSRRAVERELKEELGVGVRHVGECLFDVRDPASAFRIYFYETAIDGEPQALEHAAVRWLPAERLLSVALAPADRCFVAHRLLPPGPIGTHL